MTALASTSDQSGDAGTTHRITICACTYRRPEGLKRLLTGLSNLEFRCISTPEIDVIICDNEGHAGVQQICEAFDRSGRLRVRYVHESRQGISHGRNRCLESLRADCELFAMLDDDEWPAPDWLEALLVAMDQTGACVVRGGVVPVFSSDAPAWVRNGHMFGFPEARMKVKPRTLTDLQEMQTAATHNVLVRTECLRRLNLSFDPVLGLTGSEDDLFFKKMHRAGCRIVFAANARVFEAIPSERANMSYLIRAQYGLGHSQALVKRAFAAGDERAVRRARRQTVFEGIGTLLRSLRRALSAPLRRSGRARHLRISVLKAAYGCGLLVSAVGGRYQHYRSASPPQAR